MASNQAIASSGCSGARISSLPPFEEVKENKPLTERIYPNPTEGLVQLELNASGPGTVTVSVLDMSGKYLYSHKASAVKGNNRITMDIAALPSGVYIIEVKDGKTIAEKYKILKR